MGYKRPTITDLRQEIAELRHVGGQMANVCFNWSQSKDSISLHDREMLDQLRRQWDAIKRRVPKGQGVRRSVERNG